MEIFQLETPTNYKHYSQIVSDGDVSIIDEELSSKQICPIPNCGEKSAESHTLSQIWLKYFFGKSPFFCSTDKICHFPFYMKSEKELFDRVHIKHASTFFGFCANHDSKLFSNFEQKIFKNEGELSDRDIVLIALRVIAAERYNLLRFIQYMKKSEINVYERYKNRLSKLDYYFDEYWKCIDAANYSNIIIHYKNINQKHFLHYSHNSFMTIITVPFMSKLGVFLTYLKEDENKFNAHSIAHTSNCIANNLLYFSNFFVNYEWWYKPKNRSARKNILGSMFKDKICSTVNDGKKLEMLIK